METSICRRIGKMGVFMFTIILCWSCLPSLNCFDSGSSSITATAFVVVETLKTKITTASRRSFSPSTITKTTQTNHHQSSLSASTGNGGNDFWGKFTSFWDGSGNNKNDDGNKEGRDGSVFYSNQQQQYNDDNLPAGTLRIATIPVKSMKPGGLRLFLMFYLLGVQNTPDRNTWRADQPVISKNTESIRTIMNENTSEVDDEEEEDEDETQYVLEMLYQDATGMITIELLPTEVRISRVGSRPSTAYIMQESTLVYGILDELDLCAFDESIDPSNRLLIPNPSNAIELARDVLAFG